MPIDSAKLNEDEEACHQSYAASVGACISTIIKYMSIIPVGALIGLLLTISGFMIMISGVESTVTLFENSFDSDFGGTVTNYSTMTACFATAIAPVCYRGRSGSATSSCASASRASACARRRSRTKTCSRRCARASTAS